MTKELNFSTIAFYKESLYFLARLSLKVGLVFTSGFFLPTYATQKNSFKSSHLKDSVYEIYGLGLSDTNELFVASGTAFAISPNRFITNFHVIDFLSKTEEIILINESRELLFYKPIRLSPALDLALFEIQNPVDSFLQVSQNGIPFTDFLIDKTFFKGWRLKGWAKKFTYPEELFIIAHPNKKLSYINKKNTTVLKSQNIYAIPVNHPVEDLQGFSGAPVVNKDEEVVGVVYGSNGDPSLKLLWFEIPLGHHIYATQSSSLYNFIEGHVGIDCDTSDSLKSCIDVAKTYEPKHIQFIDDLYLDNNKN